MTRKIETIQVQVPKQRAVYDCNKCNKTITSMLGAFMIGQYEVCAEGGGLDSLLAILKGQPPSSSHEQEPHIHEEKAQHLCKSCSDLFTKFINDSSTPVEVAVNVLPSKDVH